MTNGHRIVPTPAPHAMAITQGRPSAHGDLTIIEHRRNTYGREEDRIHHPWLMSDPKRATSPRAEP